MYNSCEFINYCLNVKYFPKVWKLAKIIPNPKPGEDSLFPQNFRPISLLSTLSEIFEKIIVFRIRSSLVKNKIINDAQYGFRSGYCTIRQLTRVCYTIMTNINKNKHSSTLLLEIEKASTRSAIGL